MGDRLRTGKPPQYFTKPPSHHSLLPSAGRDKPRCGDAVRLGSKGRYGSFHFWINVWAYMAGKTIDVKTCKNIQIMILKRKKSFKT